MASGKSTGPAKQPKFALKRKHTSSQGERDTKKARVVGEATKSHKAKRVDSDKTATAPLPNKGKGKGTPTFKAEPKAKPAKPSKAKAPDAPTPLPRAFKVITGSYEKLLYGLQGSVTLSDDGELRYSLKPVFIFPAHVSAVKAVAASPAGGKWLATGSVDEIIKVWDLRRRKEVGGLMHHSGSITHLEFADRSHLFSASEDGTLALFHARDWAVLRTLKGHKGRVNAIAVHPSGKLALSVGQDRTLRMWDLMRGKASASTKIYKEGEAIRWNATGTLFVLSSASNADVFALDMTLLHSITHTARIQDVLFAEDPSDASTSILLIAAENKKVTAYSLPPQSPRDADDEENEAEKLPPAVFAEFIGHANRVKALASLRIALPTSSTQQRESTTILTTISSDGKVLLYDLFALRGLPAAPAGAEEVPQISALAEYDSTGSRLTCLTMAEDLVTSQQIAIPANDADAAGSSDVGGAEDRDGTDSMDSDAEGDAEEEKEET